MGKVDINEVAKELSGLMPVLARKFIKPFEQQTKNSVSPMQMHAMTILAEKELFTMTELANEMKIAKQQMTAIIDKLIENGFAHREHDNVDRRTIKIKLTPSGSDFLNHFQKDIIAVMKSKIDCLESADLYSLHLVLSEFYRIVRKIP